MIVVLKWQHKVYKYNDIKRTNIINDINCRLSGIIKTVISIIMIPMMLTIIMILIIIIIIIIIPINLIIIRIIIYNNNNNNGNEKFIEMLPMV